MLDVAVVMPVYNEADCIADVLRDWLDELDALGVSFLIIALNDGSKDNTAEVLKQFEGHARVRVINKQNAGHGPTILQGYRMAVEEARWVFQVDSDNEIKARYFSALWEHRQDCDMVIGVRDGRQQPLPRKIVSMVSRLIVAMFYGTGVQDVNCPFRLMRAAVLKQMLRRIPDDTFAPNVAIAGLFVLHKRPVHNVPVSHRDRKTGEVSIKKWKLLQAALKSFVQTVRIRIKG